MNFNFSFCLLSRVSAAIVSLDSFTHILQRSFRSTRSSFKKKKKNFLLEQPREMDYLCVAINTIFGSTIKEKQDNPNFYVRKYFWSA